MLDDLFSIVSCHSGEDGVEYAVRLNPEHFIFRAHFPGMPITPGVCILQMCIELLGKWCGMPLVLECAKNNRKVLKNPAPYVLFQDFGASSLIFELRCYTSDIWTGWMIPSELRFEIDRRFREEGIEIPFNQLVVHRGGEVSEESQSQFYAKRLIAEHNLNNEKNVENVEHSKIVTKKDKSNVD